MGLFEVGLLAVGGLVVYFLFWFFSDSQQVQRALRGTPRVAIGEFGDGAVARIVGRVETPPANREDGTPKETPLLEAPISGRRCLYYEVIVEEHMGKAGWRERVRDVQGIPFVVRDKTGFAIVHPERADVTLVKDHETTSGTFDDPTSEESAFLNKHGMSGEGILLNKRLRYYEGIVGVGELVAVAGRGQREKYSDPSEASETYRDGTATRLRMRAADGAPLLISDEIETTTP